MKDEAQSALRDLVIALERMDSDDLDQFRQEPGVKLLLEWVGHQRPSQTPSPDVTEVCEKAIRVYTQHWSTPVGIKNAATVIAEAKARWLAEKDAEITRLYGALRKAENLIECIKQSSNNLWWVDAKDPEIAVCDTHAAILDAIKEPKP